MADKNEKEKRSIKGHIFTPSLADDGVALANDQLNNQFSNIARTDLGGRNRRVLSFDKSATRHNGKENQQQNGDEREKCMITKGMLQFLGQQVIPSKWMFHDSTSLTSPFFARFRLRSQRSKLKIPTQKRSRLDGNEKTELIAVPEKYH